VKKNNLIISNSDTNIVNNEIEKGVVKEDILNKVSYRTLFWIIFVLIFISLCYFVKNVFFINDFLMILFLISKNSNIITWSKILIAFIPIGYAAITLIYIKLFNESKILINFHILLSSKHIMSYILISFIVLNLYIFVQSYNLYPDNFSRYESIEHLKENILFSNLANKMPNYRYEEFMRLINENNDLKKACEVGLKISPKDIVFKKTFIEIVQILMDRVDQPKYALQLIHNYIDYKREIEKLPDACQILSETIEKALDLSEKYAINEKYKDEYIDKTLFINIKQKCNFK